MEVVVEPIVPHSSVADTVGNLTYIEGDVLDTSFIINAREAGGGIENRATYKMNPSESVAYMDWSRPAVATLVLVLFRPADVFTRQAVLG